MECKWQTQADEWGVLSLDSVGCGRGCANCTSPGLCTECEGDQKLFTQPGSNITRCVRRCPLFYKLEKGASPPTCEFQHKGGKPNRQNGSKWLFQIVDLSEEIKRILYTFDGSTVLVRFVNQYKYLKTDIKIIVQFPLSYTIFVLFIWMHCPSLRLHTKPNCSRSFTLFIGGRKNPLLSDI